MKPEVEAALKQSDTPRTDAQLRRTTIENEDSCCDIYVKIDGVDYDGALIDAEFTKALEREVTRLTTALKEAEADRERLDWMDRNTGSVVWSGGGVRLPYAYTPKMLVGFEGDNVRAAIDAAKKGPQP